MKQKDALVNQLRRQGIGASSLRRLPKWQSNQHIGNPLMGSWN